MSSHLPQSQGQETIDEFENECSDLSWYYEIPKIELHVHLEGAIPLNALWELVQKYGGDPGLPDREALQRRFNYRDFPHFIDTWVWKNQFLREYEDFTFIAEATARDFAAQNILYVEAFFSPADFTRYGLHTQLLAQAIRSGLEKVPQVKVSLVADLVRDFGPRQAARTLMEVYEAKEYGIIGIGIGGSEQDYPPEPFAQVYEQARQLGFRTSAHAGEAAGAESVWGAIRSLRIDRIGHGTRAGEDPALLKYLLENKIPVEMCPISNLRTGVISKIEDHPILKYDNLGIPVTVNTDDPKMFGNSMAMELCVLEKKLGFSRQQLKSLLLGAIRVSWLPDGEKEKLSQAFNADPAFTR